MTDRILVTGGSGFIGTNLVESMIERSFEVINVDIAEPKKKDHKTYWKECDIRDFEKFNEICQAFQPTHVVHLAARTDLNGRSIADYDTNTDGVANVVRALNKLTSLKQSVIASSMLVCRLGYKFRDFDDYDPPNFYGESKVQTEKITKKNANFDWVMIRPTSIWGPWFGEPYRNFFDIVLAQKFFMSRKFATKTYGYVGNAVQQIMALLMKPEAVRNTYYLGDLKATSIREWALEISDLAGIKRPMSFPHIVFQLAALTGDLLNLIGIPFVMSSFRLQNMTTDNVIDVSWIEDIVSVPEISRQLGTKKTLEWMSQIKK